MQKASTQLNTSRLNLVPLGSADILAFHRLNTDPFVRRYLWDDEQISLDTAKEILDQNEKHFAQDRFGLWKINLKENQQLIGYTGLWYFFEEPQPQLLYAILEAYGGRGLASEAARAVMSYAFSQLNFEYLLAATDEPHRASQNVAMRLGMTLFEKRMENGKPTLFFRIEKKG